PDITSARMAYDYLNALKLMLQYLEVSDCNMQEGSLRAEPNVNLCIHTDSGDVYTPITEIKNVNSFRAVEKAIDEVAAYQLKQWKTTGVTKAAGTKSTFGWDDHREMLVPQRQKEEAEEYRYFPEPDLNPVTLDETTRQQVTRALPELPTPRYERFIEQYQLSDEHAVKLVADRGVADYFEEVARLSGEVRQSANYVINEVSRELNERGIGVGEFPIEPDRLAALMTLLAADKLSSKQGRTVFAEMLDSGKTAEAVVKEKGLEQVSDAGAIEPIVDKVIAENPGWVDDHKKGKSSANAIMGQVMRATRGKANPKQAMEIILKKLDEA
ncbi:MAG: Asp-tRNA(Asn)/Glu-tRNA(Gln) amidotransferase GatCAB subunit B, partial [Planctomycetota bacterium]